MEHFALLGSVAVKVHAEMRSIYYLLLPVFFMLSIALVWFQNPDGGSDFINKIKRVVIATLLLVGFAELTDAMLFIANGIADKIDNLSGLDAILQMASDKARSYSQMGITPLPGFDDLMIAGLTYLSWVVLYVARFIMVAVYHFSWVFLSIIAPLVLLFHVFSSNMTVRLFTTMAEIASWKVAWSILSAMLKALPFGMWYGSGGDYLTVVVLNLVIALAMLGTPLVVHSIVSGGFATMAAGLNGLTASAMLAAPAKAVAAYKFGSSAFNFAKGMNSKIGNAGRGFNFSSGASASPPPPMRDVTPRTSPPRIPNLLPPKF